MKRLIKQGLITTILGLLVIVFSGAMIYTGKASAESMSGWLAFGTMFLRSKDSILGLPKEEENI